MPKISIIVPVYNVEKYLSKCLDSLITQTMKDIEIICVNDGSTDNSLSVLKDYAKKDSRIVIIDKANSGPGACRNIGIEKATGEFIQFVDSDDWIEPETCEVCYQKAIEHNVDMVSFNANTIFENSSWRRIYYNATEEKVINWKNISHLLFKSPFHSCHYLIKSDFLKNNNMLYKTNIHYTEDVPFILNCWIKAQKVLLLPYFYYNYIQHDKSLSHTTTHIFDYFKVVEILNIQLNSLNNTELNKGFSDWKLFHVDWELSKIKNKIEKEKFLDYCNKYYTNFEKKQIKNKIGYTIKLFNFIKLFEVKHKKNKTYYKFLTICFLTKKQKNKNNTSKKIIKLFGIPIFKKNKKISTTLIKKNYYLLGIKIFKQTIPNYIKLKNIHKHSLVIDTLKTNLEKRKIRVCFLVSEPAKWNMQKVYNLMHDSKIFEPFVLVTSLKSMFGHDNYNEILSFFKSQCKNVEVGFDQEKNQPIDLKTFNPDIVFYQQPWEIWDNQGVDYVSDFALPYYISYAVSDAPSCLKYHFEDFYLGLQKYFVFTPAEQKQYQDMYNYKGENMVVVGHPKLDVYQNYQEENYEHKYVIYAPHHSFKNDSILNYGTFDWSGKFMLEWAKKHPEFKWIFKPHPALKNRLLRSKFMSASEVENYYNEWSKISLYCNDSEYFDLFKNSKCLITDCGSFLTEYLPTKQPVIHLRNNKKCDYIASNLVAMETYYKAFNLEQLENALDEVLIKENDPQKLDRLQVLKKLELEKFNSSEKIIEELMKDLGLKE